MPVNIFAAEELHAIKEKETTSVLYERAIRLFTQKIPETFEKRLSNSNKYIDLVMEIFNEKNIPLDIAYLPLIESGFSPLSVGRGGTVGLWQFVKGTAKRYGLKVDSYVDERKDPVKSTEAAARYLRDLYRIFGSWDVALAAYNAGDGKVKRMRSNRSFIRFPKFINSYLAKFMAASTVAQDPESFGFATVEDTEDETPDVVEITTTGITSLKAIAGRYDTTVRAIKDLNPALCTNYTPPYRYVLRLPDRQGF
jgi:membrane-bound lytic murein transglycosylase D